MKSQIIIINSIGILLLGCLMIGNLEFAPIFIGEMLLILILLMVTLKKQAGAFTLFSVILFISSIYLMAFQDFNLLLGIYYVYVVILLISDFNFAFNRYYNSMGLVFKHVNIPTNEKYLVVKYISGPIKICNANALLKINNDSYILQIDGKENLEELIIKFSDIKNIEIDIKPYIKTVRRLVEIENRDNSLKNRVNTNYTHYNGTKIIKSYNIAIEMTEGIINLIAFDYPELLYNFKP